MRKSSCINQKFKKGVIIGVSQFEKKHYFYQKLKT